MCKYYATIKEVDTSGRGQFASKKKTRSTFIQRFITYDWGAIGVYANNMQPLKSLTQADEVNLQARKNSFNFYTKFFNI